MNGPARDQTHKLGVQKPAFADFLLVHLNNEMRVSFFSAPLVERSLRSVLLCDHDGDACQMQGFAVSSGTVPLFPGFSLFVSGSPGIGLSLTPLDMTRRTLRPSTKKAFQTLLQEAGEFKNTFAVVGEVPWREVYEYLSVFG